MNEWITEYLKHPQKHGVGKTTLNRYKIKKYFEIYVY